VKVCFQFSKYFFLSRKSRRDERRSAKGRERGKEGRERKRSLVDSQIIKR